MSEEWIDDIIEGRMDADERALRRELVADKKASKMAPSVAFKYASSEAQSAAREDKKSKGKHIHGTVDEEYVDEEKKELPQNKMYRKAGNLGREVVSSKKGPKRDAAMERMNKIVSTINRETERKRFNEIGKSPAHNEEFVMERELDPTETKEKERLVKGLKKSAEDFKSRYGERAKSVMYATATKMAKERMDTRKSDRRYGVEA